MPLSMETLANSATVSSLHVSVNTANMIFEKALAILAYKMDY